MTPASMIASGGSLGSSNNGSTTTIATSSDFDIVSFLKQVVAEDRDISLAVAAVKSLTESIKCSKATTMSEFTQTLKAYSQTLKASTPNTISISAGCDLFLQFVTRTGHDFSDFESCKHHIMKRGEIFVRKAWETRKKIAEVGLPFIKDGAIILIHSYSRVVLNLLEKASLSNRRFKVYVTESRPHCSGKNAIEFLTARSIPCKLILDAAVGYVIENVDMVLVGAEGVVENGGIINQIGTYQMAVMAKAASKPFYAVCESYKFVRLYPLNQTDLFPPVYNSPSTPTTATACCPTATTTSITAIATGPSNLLTPTSTLLSTTTTLSTSAKPITTFPSSATSTTTSSTSSFNLEATTQQQQQQQSPTPQPPILPQAPTSNKPNTALFAFDSTKESEPWGPGVDYTPPTYISLLFTDLGVMTPSGVSDELIRVYH